MGHRAIGRRRFLRISESAGGAHIPRPPSSFAPYIGKATSYKDIRRIVGTGLPGDMSANENGQHGLVSIPENSRAYGD